MDKLVLTFLALPVVAAHVGGGFAWGFGFLFLFLFLLIIPLFWILIFSLARRRFRHRGFGPGGFGGGWGAARGAESTLAERFANGDIDEKEYRARLEVLRANDPFAQQGPRR